MYETIKPRDYLRYFNLPLEYKVDGLLCYGHWDKPRQIRNLKAVLKNYDDVQIEKMPTGFLQNVISFKIGDKRIWFDSCYGCALMTEIVHSACIFGSKINVHLGSCGSLLEDTDIELMIPKLGHSRDSSSYMYNRKEHSNNYYPDMNLMECTYSIISKDYKVCKGNVITCEAMMAESEEYINECYQKGYSGINMETASFYAIGEYFKVPSVSILKVGESMLYEETKLSDTYYVKRLASLRLVKYMYKTALDLILTKN